ncbi:MAG: DUF1616 domain-containing protein [Candidatus Bathyarchaeota archaeon]|nr:DUF1616 domain-containing protein [Candidatus Bathyarchaeota archaeon]
MVKKTRSESTNLNQHIINVVAKANPQTVEQLIKLLQSEQTIRRQEILDAVMELQRQGRITLKQPKIQSDFTLTEYILSAKGHWYWAIIALSAATALLVFAIPENAYPIVYSRHILGSIFVLWLPGYSLIKALFPTRKMDNEERIALSVGMSLASVSIVGLLLNYTPWGIGVASITLSLLALTITFSTAAVIREHMRPLDSAKQKLKN